MSAGGGGGGCLRRSHFRYMYVLLETDRLYPFGHGELSSEVVSDGLFPQSTQATTSPQKAAPPPHAPSQHRHRNTGPGERVAHHTMLGNGNGPMMLVNWIADLDGEVADDRSIRFASA